MTEQELLERVGGWFSKENLGRALVFVREHRTVIEIVVASVFFVLAFPDLANRGGLLGVFALVMFATALALYRMAPLAALALAAIATVGVLGSSYLWYGGNYLVFAPLFAVFFGTAAYGRLATRWLGLVGTLFAAIGIVGVAGLLSGVLPFLLLEATFALAWVAGMLVRVNGQRRSAETGEIQATVKLGEAKQVVSLEQERNRVARDVHDIVAHSLAVVIAQADGARYGAKNVPAPVVEALENIATTARGALTDVRVLLGELRHNQEAGPQPGMNDLDALVRGFRDSGLEVEWNSYGSAVELVGTPALAVYRIVQEGLTNALRHGDRGKPVELVFDWGSTSLAVIVTNGIPRGTAVPANTVGHGIPGMRERATLAGGELEASDGTNGRFRVRATIPFTREPAAPVSA
ncbi:sensor histidine kinase [Pseudolysinimonas sp.]|jgi:signal transduction histidine kinase|uniref:sensor histidine kinase n=1 Tax=Pseudolysinimonas sp. TaxID=2680009 RepID=UPI0037842FBA